MRLTEVIYYHLQVENNTKHCCEVFTVRIIQYDICLLGRRKEGGGGRNIKLTPTDAVPRFKPGSISKNLISKHRRISVK